MPNSTELSTFLQELHDDVKARLDSYGDSEAVAEDLAFTELVADELAEYGAIDSIVPCALDQKTSKGRVACSGYFIDEEAERVDLFVSFYRQATEDTAITQTDIRSGFDRAVRIFDLLEKGFDFGGITANEPKAMLAAIREACASTKEIRVFILSDCIARDTEEVRESRNGITVRCLIWDANRLLKVRNSGKEYESVAIDLGDFGAPEGLPCIATPESNAGYRTYLTLVPGRVLFELYDEYGPRILQLNVRSFLQIRSKVNRGIRATIINEPERFLAYNNGITGTAEGLLCESEKSGIPRIRSLQGFQIVNGGQTVATIHHAAKIDKASLDNVWVQAKISVVTGPQTQELVSNISRFSNSQNRINDADFSSNDSFHVRLEELSNRLWIPGEGSRWFYERARGQYQVSRARDCSTPAAKRKFDKEVPNRQRFSKTDLAKCWNSWGQRPEIVSRGAQKNFVAFMEFIAASRSSLVQDETWYRRVIAQIILYKTAESIARELEINAYRANVVTYTVALLSYRSQQGLDLDMVWQRQSVSSAIRATVKAWMPKVIEELVNSACGRNVTEWCKKLECWRHVQTLGLPFVGGLEEELVAEQPIPNVGSDASEKELRLTEEERNKLATVMLVPDEVWLDIHKWGLRNGNLKEFECGIAHTLVSYAANGWAKVPSRKQVKYAVEILEKARGQIETLDRIINGSELRT